MNFQRSNAMQILAALLAGSILTYVVTRWLRDPISNMPKFGVLFADTTSFFRVLEPVPPISTVGDTSGTVSASSGMTGSVMFKYYIHNKRVFSLHGWKLNAQGNGNNLVFNARPDIRLSVGYELMGLKTLDGDYIGSFVFQQAELEHIRSLCRNRGFGFIHFYPVREDGAPYVSWRIILAKGIPAAQQFYSDTLQNDTFDAGSYNPIPPKGYTFNEEGMNN